ncbi:hypothetical protein Avbf_17392 [Armadillidium vulgare]|nr:hypothetical protein Avbf_17392 [Armadillidium vulgare]
MLRKGMHSLIKSFYSDVRLSLRMRSQIQIKCRVNILHSKSKSSKRVSSLAEIHLITSWLNPLPINEEYLALKKRRLHEASLRSIFQKEKIRWARHCQDIKRLGVGLLIKCNQAWSFQSKDPRVFY